MSISVFFCEIKRRMDSLLIAWNRVLHRSEYDSRYLSIALPAAWEGLLMILLSNADLIMVGRLGTAAVAAVSIFTQPRMMLLTLSRSLAAVLTLLAARHYGRQEPASAGSLMKQTLFFWGILLAIAHLLFYHCLADILIWMGAENSYLPEALRYAEIALLAVFFSSMTVILQAVPLGFGETAVVLWINLRGNILNIIASAILIFGIGPFSALGVQGAAIGTVLGAACSLAETVLFLQRKHLFKGEFLPTRAYFRQFLPVFGGVFSEQGCERIGMVLYTRMAAELGTISYAVHAICMNFCDFYYSFAGGLGKANMALAGQTCGKRDFKAWKHYLSSGMRWGLIFSILSFILTFLLREEIFSIYSEDGDALALGTTILIMVAAVSFPEAHAMICSGVLRGSGKTTQVAVYSFLSITLFRPLITAFFLYYMGWGLMGAWLALALDQTVRAVCSHFLVWRILSQEKENFF